MVEIIASNVFVFKILLSIAVGALIGIEREHAKHKRMVGVRTFSLMSLIGTLAVLVSPNVLPSTFVSLPLIGFAGVIAYSVLFYYLMFTKKGPYGLTTTITFPLTYVFGVMVGYGMFYETIAGAIVTTVLLMGKGYSHVFVKHLSDEEIYDALQFGILLFVIYPLLPQDPIHVTPMIGVDLRLFLLIVMMVSFMSFIGFLAIRFFGQRALIITGFFGGFINSVFTVASFASKSKKAKGAFSTGLAAASLAMLLRDLLLVGIVAPALLGKVWLPLLGMAFVFALFAAPAYKKEQGEEIVFQQPFSVSYGVSFGAVFFLLILAVNVVSALNPNSLFLTALFGGFVSSAAVASSVSLVLNAGGIGMNDAAVAVIIACLASLMMKTVILLTAASDDFKKSALPSLAVALVVGLALLFLTLG